MRGKLNLEERFNNRKCKVEHLERNNPMHMQGQMADEQLLKEGYGGDPGG